MMRKKMWSWKNANTSMIDECADEKLINFSITDKKLDGVNYELEKGRNDKWTNYF